MATDEPLSFWGGVDPATGNVIDVRHPLHGRSVGGRVLFMPTSRGSCTGSGVLLDLVLSGRGPAAIVFSEAEDILTLGALIAAEMFGKPMPIVGWKSGHWTVDVEGTPESVLAASWRYCYPFNLVGLPALSLPCGFDADGLAADTS